MTDIDIGKLKVMSLEDLKNILEKIRQARAERPAPTTRRARGSGSGFSSKSTQPETPATEISADDFFNIGKKKE